MRQALLLFQRSHTQIRMASSLMACILYVQYPFAAMNIQCVFVATAQNRARSNNTCITLVFAAIQ